MAPVPSCNGGEAHSCWPPRVPGCPQQTAGVTVGEAPVCGQGERWTQGHGMSPGHLSWPARWGSPIWFGWWAAPMPFLLLFCCFLFVCFCGCPRASPLHEASCSFQWGGPAVLTMGHPVRHAVVKACGCPAKILSLAMRVHSVGSTVWQPSKCRVAHQGTMQAWGWCTRYAKPY